MHPTLRVSGPGQKSAEPLFTPSSAFPVAQNTQLANVSGSLTEQLTGIQQIQGVMTGYAFQDFLNYFLMQQPAPTGAIPPSAPSGPVLSTSGLQLNIQLERSQAHLLPVHNGQPVAVQAQPGLEGLTGAVRLSTPELHADGAMTYTVTVLKQALRQEDMAPLLAPLLVTQTLGRLPLVQASASAGSPFQHFFEQDTEAAELADWEQQGREPDALAE
ncbi:MAG: hypothetical protein ACO1RX_01660 [Candidatus Sericytochromatia bacterium]